MNSTYRPAHEIAARLGQLHVACFIGGKVASWFGFFGWAILGPFAAYVIGMLLLAVLFVDSPIADRTAVVCVIAVSVIGLLAGGLL